MKIIPTGVFIAIISLYAGAAGASDADSSVTIVRDDWGVPHIAAEREEQAYFGLGYAQAEDRLSALLGGMYWARGRLAELQGEAALAGDIEQRRWRHVEEGRRGLERLVPQVARNYEYFAAGIRRYMQDHPEAVPAWAPEFDARDFLVISRALFYTAYASVLGPAECERQGARLYSSVTDFANSGLRGASNVWVVGPSRTANGSLFLLADPHIEVQSGAYYEYRLKAGEIDAAGFAMGPLLWQSHNRHVAWGMTTGNTDMWDCYAVEVDPNNPNRYRFDGEWRDIQKIEETFQIAGREPHTEIFEYTMHNDVMSPVVARNDNTAYVISTSQMHDTGILHNEIRNMVRARSVHELRDAMSTLGMFPQNIAAGDSGGNIFYWRAGKTPIRPTGYNWLAAVPGNTSATAWQGYHAFDDMVQILNPEEGYLQNHNVAPDRMYPDEKLRAADFAPELFNDDHGRVTSRGLRTIEVLSAAEGFTVDDAMALVFDEKWITTDSWVPALRRATQQHPQWAAAQSPETQEVLRRILDFDGNARAESVAAFNFYTWRNTLGEILSNPDFAHLLTLPWSENDLTPAFGLAILNKVEEATAAMLDSHGRTDVQLGDVFRVGRGSETFPVGGETIDASDNPLCVAYISPLCERTMRAFASGAPDDNGHRRVYRGSVATRLIEFGDTVRAWSLYAHGQNDDPQSPHFNDQARLISERTMKSEFLDPDELAGHTESTLQLVVNDVGLADGQRRYRILISNDDGIESEGIRTLAIALAEFADVFVSAPEKNESGASQSSRLLRSRATATPVDIAPSVQAIAVNGTPSDSAAFGLDYFARDVPMDLVISGINDGGNYGDGYYYSGTVGAAFQALVQGVPSIAVSQDAERTEFDVSTEFTLRVVRSLLQDPLPEGVLLSINIPAGEIQGARARPGRGVTFDLVMNPAEDGEGTYYKPKFTIKDTVEPGFDVESYAAGYITVTPLKMDRNDYDSLVPLRARPFMLRQP